MNTTDSIRAPSVGFGISELVLERQSSYTCYRPGVARAVAGILISELAAMLELRPATGTLTAKLFENARIGLGLSVFFYIEIPVEPFDYGDSTHRTSLRLDFIELPVRSWRELKGREFSFPTNPDPGFIDGSLYLDGAHNPADVTLIRFGEPNTDVVPIAIKGSLDFTIEGPEELGVVALDWTTELTFESQKLDWVFAEARTHGVL